MSALNNIVDGVLASAVNRMTDTEAPQRKQLMDELLVQMRKDSAEKTMQIAKTGADLLKEIDDPEVKEAVKRIIAGLAD